MAKNLHGLAVIHDSIAEAGQTHFYLTALPGTVSLVFVAGDLRTDYSYTGSTLVLEVPAVGGEQVVVFSGQGGTFIPQSYVEGLVQGLVSQSYVDNRLSYKLSTTGGNMTGHVKLASDPTDPLHPATKQYVDARLDPVALLADVDTRLAARATTDYVDSAFANALHRDELNYSVAALDAGGTLVPWQVPDYVRQREIFFPRTGTIAVGGPRVDQSWYPRQSGFILESIADLGNTGTATFNIYKEGVLALATDISVTAGTRKEDTFGTPISFARGQRIGIEITSVSNPAPINMMVQLECIYG